MERTKTEHRSEQQEGCLGRHRATREAANPRGGRAESSYYEVCEMDANLPQVWSKSKSGDLIYDQAAQKEQQGLGCRGIASDKQPTEPVRKGNMRKR